MSTTTSCYVGYSDGYNSFDISTPYYGYGGYYRPYRPYVYPYAYPVRPRYVYP